MCPNDKDVCELPNVAVSSSSIIIDHIRCLGIYKPYDTSATIVHTSNKHELFDMPTITSPWCGPNTENEEYMQPSRSIFAMQLTHVTHVMKIATTTACFSGTPAKQQG